MKTMRLYITASLAISLLLTATASGESGLFGRFTTYPSRTENNAAWIVRDVNPGKTYREFITLENLTDNNLTLQTKIIESSGNRPQIELIENSPPQNAGLWIKTEEQKTLLARREKKQIALTIEIPQNTAPGEYQAVAMVSEIGENNRNPSGMNINTRIGNRIYLTVTDRKDLQSNTFGPEDYQLQIALILLSLGGIAYGTYTNKQKKHSNEQSKV
jgi:hypothetical protein